MFAYLPDNQSGLARRITRSMIGITLTLAIMLLGSITEPVLAASADATMAAPKAPTVTDKFAGVFDPNSSPPSPVVAASPNRVMELTNTRYELFNQAGNGKEGLTSALATSPGVFLGDPQVMWDPATSRFYYSFLENRGTSTPDEGIAWGFSKTATPATAADFCSYFTEFNYGSTALPDRQSLGDTSDFLLIGDNRWTTNGETMLGTDIAWISKPAPGSVQSCPNQSSFQTGVQSLHNPDGSTLYTPVPGRQVDSSGTGWIVATASYASASSLTLFGVTKNPTTGSAIIGAPTSIAVPSYSYPHSAPQAGTTMSGQPAPTLETNIYFSQVIMAYDPRIGHLALWTADTVAGGAGTEARWYEINPQTSSLDQVGTVSDPNLDVFNATISPDRLVNGSVAKFGSDAVINVNTSSATSYPAIEMVSKVGAGAQSPLKLIKQSTGADIDFTCFEAGATECRWGDLSGATPDPGASPSGKIGRVWLSNEWNIASTSDQGMDWRTQLWQAKP